MAKRPSGGHNAPYHALPETDDFYFWRQADIDAAQAELDALPVGATDEEKAAAEAKLQQAQDAAALAQEGTELYQDGLKAAQDGGWNLADSAASCFALPRTGCEGRHPALRTK